MRMTRTMRPTGRRKLKRSEVRFFLNRDHAGPPTFEANWEIDSKFYPDDSHVYVEASVANTLQRFSFGTLEDIKPPENRSLDKLDLTSSVKFTVYIVDQTETAGRLLASGIFRANDDDIEEGSRPLIAVKTYDLGQQVWKVDFSQESPELVINQNIPDAIHRIQTDLLFQGLVLPAMLKSILTHILWNEERDDESVEAAWIHIAEELGDKLPNTEDPVKLNDWIDGVVDEFSRKHKFCDSVRAVLEGTA